MFSGRANLAKAGKCGGDLDGPRCGAVNLGSGVKGEGSFGVKGEGCFASDGIDVLYGRDTRLVVDTSGYFVLTHTTGTGIECTLGPIHRPVPEEVPAVPDLATPSTSLVATPPRRSCVASLPSLRLQPRLWLCCPRLTRSHARMREATRLYGLD